jgi:hypothetical protein
VSSLLQARPLFTLGSSFNPDSAVEREGMSKEQTFRSENNAPLRRRQLSVRFRNVVTQMELRASAKKDFETKQSSVFATPGLLLAHFQLRNPGSNLSPAP